MKLVAWMTLGLLMLAPAFAADTEQSKTPDRILRFITGDAELARLDEELNAAYNASLTDEKHADALKRFQQLWLKERNRSLIAESVKKISELQLSFLKLRIVTTPVSNLLAERGGYTATLLANGKVLIAGGFGDRGNGVVNLDSAELFDPATGHFTATGNLTIARSRHTAVLLPNGKVLLAGGETNGNPDWKKVHSAEIYDPASGTFSSTGSFKINTINCSATLLANGKVLFIGQKQNESEDSTAEIYYPASGRFTATGKPVNTWCGSTTTLLSNGEVLVVGDDGAALYDPSRGRFTATGPMLTHRSSPAAALLQNGKVLVTGGISGPDLVVSAELYDPATGTFSRTGDVKTARWGHSSFLLPTGKVLIARGYWIDPMIYPSLELYDPGTGEFSSAGRFSECYECRAIQLKDGKVLFLGKGSAEIYDPTSIN